LIIQDILSSRDTGHHLRAIDDDAAGACLHGHGLPRHTTINSSSHRLTLLTHEPRWTTFDALVRRPIAHLGILLGALHARTLWTSVVKHLASSSLECFEAALADAGEWVGPYGLCWRAESGRTGWCKWH
jgi:hypothetical protein